MKSYKILCHKKIWRSLTAQKIKFYIKDFFSKCDQIRRMLRIWLDLLKKSLKENIFCAVSLNAYVKPDTDNANFDSRGKRSAATDFIKSLVLLILFNFFGNIFYEILTCPLSEYCHDAFLESTLNFEHFQKLTFIIYISKIIDSERRGCFDA